MSEGDRRSSGEDGRGGRASGQRPRSWHEHPLTLVIAGALFGAGGLVTWAVQQAVGGGQPDGSSATGASTVTVTAPAPTAGAGGGAAQPTGGAPAPAAGASEGFSVQWGPLALNIGRADLQAVPPLAGAPGAVTDVSSYWRTPDGRAELRGASGARVAAWTETAAPDARQCFDLATSLSAGDVPVGPGDRVCVAMEDSDERTYAALLEVTEVTGATAGEGQVLATVTVWREG